MSRSAGEIATIAEGLSEAQRAVLRRCSKDERLMGGFYGLAYTKPPLVDAGDLNHPVFGPHYHLNETGLAVRAFVRQHLERKPPQP